MKSSTSESKQQPHQSKVQPKSNTKYVAGTKLSSSSSSKKSTPKSTTKKNQTQHTGRSSDGAIFTEHDHLLFLGTLMSRGLLNATSSEIKKISNGAFEKFTPKQINKRLDSARKNFEDFLGNMIDYYQEAEQISQNEGTRKKFRIHFPKPSILTNPIGHHHDHPLCKHCVRMEQIFRFGVDTADKNGDDETSENISMETIPGTVRRIANKATNVSSSSTSSSSASSSTTTTVSSTASSVSVMSRRSSTTTTSSSSVATRSMGRTPNTPSPSENLRTSSSSSSSSSHVEPHVEASPLSKRKKLSPSIPLPSSAKNNRTRQFPSHLQFQNHYKNITSSTQQKNPSPVSSDSVTPRSKRKRNTNDDST